MTEKIKLDYRLADEMIRTFRKGHQQLEQTMREMQGVANTLESGALLGQGGDTMRDAVRGDLCKAINNLAEKFKELEGDVGKAVEYMKAVDDESRKHFS
jgi:uncharacterized protein YukE